MPREYLKKATLTSESDAGETQAIVTGILNDIEAGGEAAAKEYAAKFDKYDGNVLLTQDEIDAAIAKVSDRLKADIDFAHANVKRFAEAQRGTIADFDIEVVPGLTAGQKSIPVDAAGCYIPGGRYMYNGDGFEATDQGGRTFVCFGDGPHNSSVEITSGRCPPVKSPLFLVFSSTSSLWTLISCGSLTSSL